MVLTSSDNFLQNHSPFLFDILFWVLMTSELVYVNYQNFTREKAKRKFCPILFIHSF